MPTPDPPTPTHEHARDLIRWCTSTHSPMKRTELFAYVRGAESTAADLLKLEKIVSKLYEVCRTTPGPCFCGAHFSWVETPTPEQDEAARLERLESIGKMRERIAELEKNHGDRLDKLVRLCGYDPRNDEPEWSIGHLRNDIERGMERIAELERENELLKKKCLREWHAGFNAATGAEEE